MPVGGPQRCKAVGLQRYASGRRYALAPPPPPTGCALLTEGPPRWVPCQSLLLPVLYACV